MRKKKSTPECENYPWVKEGIKYAEFMGREHNGAGKRSRKFVEQYKKHGWCLAELWNLDHEFAKWMLPRLKAFKKYKCGCPANMEIAEWDEILDNIIIGLEIMVDADRNWNYDIEDDKIVTKAMELFGKYIRGLWI